MASLAGVNSYPYQDLDSEQLYHPKFFARKFGLTVSESEEILKKSATRKEANRLGNQARLAARGVYNSL